MKRWLVTFRYQDGSVAGEVYAAGKTATAAVSSIRRRGSGYEPWVVTLTHRASGRRGRCRSRCRSD